MKKRYLIVISIAAILIAALAAIFAFYSKSENKKVSIPKNESVEPANLPEPQLTMVAVGDIMLSRNVAAKMQENGIDYPLQNVEQILKTGDITFANLETPITSGPNVPTGSMIFHANPGSENALKDAGIIIVSLANNHTPNYGQKGLEDTFKILSQAGIQYVGAGKNDTEASAPRIIEAKGIKVAFLAYNDSDVVPENYGAGPNRSGTNLMDTLKMEEAVRETKQKADLVVVSMHSGTEYKPLPNQRQEDFAHAAIDAGADLVLGHHPHVLEPVENYKGKLILYSLGNFVFDQMFSLETRESAIAKISLDKKGVTKIEFIPAMIYDYSQPRVATEETARQKIFKELGVAPSGMVEVSR